MKAPRDILAKALAKIDLHGSPYLVADQLAYELRKAGVHLVTTPELTERAPVKGAPVLSAKALHVIKLRGAIDDAVIEFSGSVHGDLWHSARDDDRYAAHRRRDVARHWLRALGQQLGLET